MFDFTIGAGSGFVLPGSGEALVTGPGCPSGRPLLLGLGLLPPAEWVRPARRTERR